MITVHVLGQGLLDLNILIQALKHLNVNMDGTIKIASVICLSINIYTHTGVHIYNFKHCVAFYVCNLIYITQCLAYSKYTINIC